MQNSLEGEGLGKKIPTGDAKNRDLIGRLNKAASPAERGKQDGTT